jgi:hypothetical protein
MKTPPVRECISSKTLLRSDRALGEVEDLLLAVRRLLLPEAAGTSAPSRRILVAAALDDLRRRARKADPCIPTRSVVIDALDVLYEECSGDLLRDPRRSLKSLDRALEAVRGARTAVCSFVGNAIGFSPAALGR